MGRGPRGACKRDTWVRPRDVQLQTRRAPQPQPQPGDGVTLAPRGGQASAVRRRQGSSVKDTCAATREALSLRHAPMCVTAIVGKCASQCVE